jgi:EpsI family protein
VRPFASAATANLALLVAIALGMTLGARNFQSIRIAEHQPLADFPLIAGDWRGVPGALDPAVLKALQLSDYWIADYQGPDAPIPVNFYIAFYATQRAGSATHSPSSCIPGGGWKIVEDGIKTVALDGLTLQVRRILIQKGSSRQIVYYWFDERGRDLTGEVAVKWWMLRDSLVEHRNDGALIRLVAPLPAGEGPERSEQALADLLRAIYPSLRSYLPSPIAGAGV